MIISPEELIFYSLFYSEVLNHYINKKMEAQRILIYEKYEAENAVISDMHMLFTSYDWYFY